MGQLIDASSGATLGRCEVCWLPALKARCKDCLAGKAPQAGVEIARAFAQA